MEQTFIQKAITPEQIKLCYPAMKQLRPHFTDESIFIEQIQRQLSEGYNLVYCESKNSVKAVSGFRILEFLAWGKVLYIDDLVTDSQHRKGGYGTQLLTWIIEQGKKAGCKQVHLDSGPQRHDAHRLYLNNRFNIIAHHFSLEI